MSSEFKLLPNEPILLLTVGEDFNYRVDMPPDLQKILSIFNQQTQPIFFILDVRLVNVSLDDLMAGTSMMALQSNVFKHPNMKEGIVVTESRMFDLAVKGIRSPIFGGIKLKVIPTLDEALAYARKNASMRDAI